jgi:hypothetical protein
MIKPPKLIATEQATIKPMAKPRRGAIPSGEQALSSLVGISQITFNSAPTVSSFHRHWNGPIFDPDNIHLGPRFRCRECRPCLQADIQSHEIEVRCTPDTVTKLRPRKIRATVIRRHTLLGKNESLHP